MAQLSPLLLIHFGSIQSRRAYQERSKQLLSPICELTPGLKEKTALSSLACLCH